MSGSRTIDDEGGGFAEPESARVDVDLLIVDGSDFEVLSGCQRGKGAA